jgi:hypothetical protein
VARINDIQKQLNTYFRIDGDFSINHTTGTVSVGGDVVLSEGVKATQLPVTFDRVGGDFYCSYNQLTSLAGSPTSVGGGFDCSYDTNLPLLRLLTYQNIMMFDVPSQLKQILEKRAGTGRRGAIQAAREILQAGEQVQQLQGLDHNPFERNARW